MMDEVNRGEKRSTLRFKLVCKGFRPFIEEARFRPRRHEGKWVADGEKKIEAKEKGSSAKSFLPGFSEI